MTTHTHTHTHTQRKRERKREKERESEENKVTTHASMLSSICCSQHLSTVRLQCVLGDLFNANSERKRKTTAKIGAFACGCVHMCSCTSIFTRTSFFLNPMEQREARLFGIHLNQREERETWTLNLFSCMLTSCYQSSHQIKRNTATLASGAL